ncbi:peptide deformylase [Candidatus Kaiserbacteria bacterium RIFCSPHIGHO2_01_FULL_49_13]|uniref:Peptide deformylase n=1 Tax=Candidatus Kaiserbacteria bacterium RIFCSPHIGHO2_01_FULL_49_13 TaxID=1798477 RepID=A0A1F6CDB3_9BACT|nr:MAG: peptide deformylase [Candidatus Kaiserbacteria bacterium RIFCSPHIGHO2_01_FULL_49_13]
MVHIVSKDSEALRQIAEKVPLKDIGSARLGKILEDMREALDSQDDGVAIAAPQIGVPLRIFVVSRRILRRTGDQEVRDLVCINPEISKLSKEKSSMEEGCLSVRWLYGKVSRSTRATIKAYDENGKSFIRGASGLLAQIFQHETDHLNGILFTDTATDLHKIPPPEMKREPGITNQEKTNRSSPNS